MTAGHFQESGGRTGALPGTKPCPVRLSCCVREVGALRRFEPDTYQALGTNVTSSFYFYEDG
jgi:hypothetical protein